MTHVVPSSLESTVRAEIVAAERPDRPIRRLLRAVRAWIDTHPRLDRIYRFSVGVIGGALTVVGLLLVPLPGPGWLVVFLGLAVLGTEFRWARRLAAAAQATARPVLGVVARASSERISTTCCADDRLSSAQAFSSSYSPEYWSAHLSTNWSSSWWPSSFSSAE